MALPSFLEDSSEPCFASRMKWPSLNRSILPVVNLSPSCAKTASRSNVYVSLSGSPVVACGRGTPSRSQRSMRNESLFALSAAPEADHLAMNSVTVIRLFVC